MDIFPTLIVLPVLQNRQINTGKLFTDPRKMGIVPAVSPDVNLPGGSFNEKRCP